MTECKLEKDIIKEGKSCGMNKIRPEVLKSCSSRRYHYPIM